MIDGYITRADVIGALEKFSLHIAEHQCSAGDCDVRLRLWLTAVATSWDYGKPVRSELALAA